MPDTPPSPNPPAGAVFLSYASQDAEAVGRIAEALRAAGVEVWFDKDELVGGDAWDAKIRGQISSCALFVPVISASTQARLEGYFRIEWKLAAQRTHAMAEEKAFLLPVVIDDTRDTDAKVPGEFRAVQWTRLPGGESPAVEKFCARVGKLLGGDAASVVAGVADPGPVVGAPLDGARGRGRATPLRKPSAPWLIPAVLGLVTVATLALWQPWRGSTASSPASAPAAQHPPDSVAAAPTGPTAQALQLRALDGLTRERLGAAEELLAQTLKTAPTDAEALAVAAQVDALMAYRSWDLSEERRQSATRRSARAVALAPEGFEPRRAQAMVAGFMIRSPASTKEAEALYRALAAERTSDQSVLEELGTLLQGLRRYDEAAQVFAQGRRPQLAGNAYYAAGQIEEARRIADELLTQRRSAAALILKANVELFGYNDLAAAQATVNQLTSTELREDDAAGISLRLAVLSRDAPGILRLLDTFPHPFVSIVGVNYPRQYWTGIARSLLNQPEAAQIEWRGGLRSIEERLRARPNDADALSWAAMFHAVLGNRAEMEQALRTYANYRDLTTGRWDFNHCLPLVRLRERTDEVIARLAKSLRDTANFNKILYAWARYSPEFDPIRGDPRFEQLLREVRPKSAKPFDDEVSARSATPPPDPKSVAVLAFRQLSADPENEYLCEAISDELCNVLGRVPGLKVAASASAFSFKGKRVRPSEMAAQLGVAYLVDGSVQKVGTRVRVRAQLIKAVDESTAWSSELLEREAKDMFALQDQVVGAIAQKLQVQLGASPVAAITINPEAYRLYYEGRRAWSMRGTEEFAAKAQDFFRQAIVADPKLGRAYSGLADTLRSASSAGGDALTYAERNSARMRELESLVDTALRLEPESAEAYASRGGAFWQAWRVVESEQDLRKAIRLNPNYADAHLTLGRLLSADGRLEEAIAEIKLAIELDPLSSRVFDNYSGVLREAGRYTEALAQADRALALQPASEQALRYKMQALSELGRHDEALAMAQSPDFPGLRFRAVAVLVRAGRKEEAAKLYSTLNLPPRNRTLALAALGRYEEALDSLQADNANMTAVSTFLYTAALDPIRNDPRFVTYLTTLGIKAAHDRAQAWRAAHPPEKVELEK